MQVYSVAFSADKRVTSGGEDKDGADKKENEDKDTLLDTASGQIALQAEMDGEVRASLSDVRFGAARER